MGDLDWDGGMSAELGDRSELDVLLEQLDELLGEGVTSPEDALELAAVAGLAARLGPPGGSLDEVEVWRDDGGLEMVEEALDELDLDVLVEALDNLDGADDHEVEEALSDFDDVVAAAVWVGLEGRVVAAALRVGALIRAVPDPFAFMADTGRQMAESPVVEASPGAHDYWFAIAESGAWAEA